MNQFKGLMRHTWWLWTAFILLISTLSALVSVAFLIMLPICFIIAVYFAMMRFDKDGNPIDEG